MAILNSKAKPIIIGVIFFLAIAVGAPFAVLAQTPEIGVASFVSNYVTLSKKLKTRQISVTDSVFFRETLKTGKNSRTQLLFLDESVLTLGPQGSLVIDEMIYDAAQDKNKLAVTINEGIMRFVSGVMPPENYTINTPSAAIGIRGTIIYVMVTPIASMIFVQSGVALIKARDAKPGDKPVVVREGQVFAVKSGDQNPTPPIAIPHIFGETVHSNVNISKNDSDQWWRNGIDDKSIRDHLRKRLEERSGNSLSERDRAYLLGEILFYDNSDLVIQLRGMARRYAREQSSEQDDYNSFDEPPVDPQVITEGAEKVKNHINSNSPGSCYPSC